MNTPTDKHLDSPPDAPDRGRRALMVGTAAVAAVAGIALALRHQQQAQPLVASGLDADLWGLEWSTPQGKTLQMQSFKGRPLLLNFWATWCPPCVQELPLLNAFYRQNASAGWQVLGLALDGLAPVQAFLKKAPLDFPVAMAGLPGMALSRSLGNLTGGLPFSSGDRRRWRRSAPKNGPNQRVRFTGLGSLKIALPTQNVWQFPLLEIAGLAAVQTAKYLI